MLPVGSFYVCRSNHVEAFIIGNNLTIIFTRLINKTPRPHLYIGQDTFDFQTLRMAPKTAKVWGEVKSSRNLQGLSSIIAFVSIP